MYILYIFIYLNIKSNPYGVKLNSLLRQQPCMHTYHFLAYLKPFELITL